MVVLNTSSKENKAEGRTSLMPCVCVCVVVPLVDFPWEHVSDGGRIPPVPELSTEIINGSTIENGKVTNGKLGDMTTKQIISHIDKGNAIFTFHLEEPFTN